MNDKIENGFKFILNDIDVNFLLKDNKIYISESIWRDVALRATYEKYKDEIGWFLEEYPISKRSRFPYKDVKSLQTAIKNCKERIKECKIIIKQLKNK